MKRIMKFACVLVIVVVSFSASATAQKKAKDSKTTYAKEALQPYVDNGQLAGAISVFYKDGVQETCCVGYADVAQDPGSDGAWQSVWPGTGLPPVHPEYTARFRRSG